MLTVLLLLTAAVAAVRGMWSPCGLSMLSALNPVAERARGNRFWVTGCWYVAGSLGGGALLGAGCAAAAYALAHAGLPSTATWGLALVAAITAALSDARLGGWSLPMHPRQVDERWLTRYRRWIYAGGYGVQIGTGLATYVMTAGCYLVIALAALTAQPAAAFAAGLLFGLVRGLTIALAGRATDPTRLQRLLARVEEYAGASAVLAASACIAVAVTAAGELAGPGLSVAVAIPLLIAAAYRPLLSYRLSDRHRPARFVTIGTEKRVGCAHGRDLSPSGKVESPSRA